MPRFTGLSFGTLHERLGPPDQKRASGGGLQLHAFHMFWFCNSDEPGCVAFVKAADRPMPPDLSAREQEFFEHAPFPKEGWTLNACRRHGDAFRDFPEEE